MRLKTIIYQLLIALVALFAPSCHEDRDDILTQAHLSLYGEGIELIGVVASADFTNLNTQSVTSTTITSGHELVLSLQRGIYRVAVQGTVSYRDAEGKTHERRFRAYQDLIPFTNVGTSQGKIMLYLL